MGVLSGGRVVLTSHDMADIIDTVEEARLVTGAPAAIIAHTVKGKGVSYMENDFTWHSRVPTDEELATALAELGEGDSSAGGAS